jgi:hypothetical protein
MATATKETVLVTVEGVQETGRNGFWEMEVAEYDEPLATKEQKIIDLIKNVPQGSQARVEMGVKQNGDFTNRYLNAFTLGDVPGNTPQPVAPAGPTKRDERQETQNRIQAQWAIGRAVEIHAATGGDLGSLLDSDNFARLTTVAESLLAAANKLAEKA